MQIEKKVTQLYIFTRWLTSLCQGPAILDYPLEDNTALPHLKVDFMWHTCRTLGMQVMKFVVHIFDHAHHYVTA